MEDHAVDVPCRPPPLKRPPPPRNCRASSSGVAGWPTLGTAEMNDVPARKVARRRAPSFIIGPAEGGDGMGEEKKESRTGSV